MVIPIKNDCQPNVVVIVTNKYSDFQEEAQTTNQIIGKFKNAGNPLLSPIFHNLITHSIKVT